MEGRRVLEAVLPPDAPRRARKLAALTLVLLVVTAVLAAVEVVRGSFVLAVGTTLMMLTSAGVLAALRRGASLTLLTLALLGVGLAAASVLAMGAGREGLVSMFWMALAPLIALAVGGRRAGWWTLLLTGGLVLLTLYGIEHRWVIEALPIERTSYSRALSLLGVCITAFLLTRAYEVETETSIAVLQAQNEELQVLRRQADQASRAKSEFLATISHEIRTPLNGVTGMIALLRDEREPERVKQGLQIIEQSAGTLLAVISDVLDFSKIESGHLQLEAVPVSPAAEVKSVLELLQPRAAERGTDLELVVAPGVPAWLVSDPTRWRQVATNLVSNAVKFTEQGRVTCRLKAEGPWLTLEVEDTGIGMSPEVVARLFEPFAQADASTTRRFGGTGLGLVISRRLVQAMGGEVSVTSAPGVGSCVTVRLPIVPAAPPAPLVAAPVAVTPRREVLVVEDNFVNQVVVTRLLEKLGHAVTVATDGQQAVNACAGRTFDLVLMDCHMPVMDGFEASRVLRHRGFTRPIYALTAAVTADDRDRCLASGMNGMLSKPLRVARLVEVLAGL